jgi:RNase P subunit RPR2
MIKSELDELSKDAIIICKRCSGPYWRLLKKSELIHKSKTKKVRVCFWCGGAHYYVYSSTSELIKDIDFNIMGLQRNKHRGYESDVNDLEELKASLMQRAFKGELVR